MLSNKSNNELVEAGHQFAKALDADMPLTEIAKLVSALSTRLDCAIVRGDELQQKLDALAAENAVLKKALNPSEIPEEAITAFENTVEFDHDFKEGNSWTWVDNETEVIRAVLAAMGLPETPATDAYLNSVRADAVVEVSAHLADMAEGKSPHTAELIRSCGRAVFAYAAQIRSGTHDTADKAGAK